LQQYYAPGNLLNLISPSEHSKRRKIWDKAFTPSAIKSYEAPLQARLAQLLGQLDQRVDQPIDFADWMGFMSMDFMNDFAYGGNGNFDALAQGTDKFGVHHAGVYMLGMNEVAGTVPWIRPVLTPVLRRLPTQFKRLAINSVITRMEKGSQFRDLFYYLVRQVFLPARATSDLAR
jgi:cytochrome P450